MNNNNKVEAAIAGLNCWASYATGYKIFMAKKIVAYNLVN